MESELLGGIWRWGLSPYKDRSGPTQQMREHRDGGLRKWGLKAEGTWGRWDRGGERKWWMDGAADQRKPRVCLALALKESQENRLGVLFSPGERHSAHSTALGVTQTDSYSFTLHPSWPAQPRTNPRLARVAVREWGKAQWDCGV